MRYVLQAFQLSGATFATSTPELSAFCEKANLKEEILSILDHKELLQSCTRRQAVRFAMPAPARCAVSPCTRHQVARFVMHASARCAILTFSTCPCRAEEA